MLDPTTAQQRMTEHPYYRYRGCAPDVDDPRVAAGDVGLSVGAWQAPDLDGPEDQQERRSRESAAIKVCGGCPVRAQCLAYGSSVTAEGKLAEPFAILGGMTPLERHRAFVKTRHEVVEAAPDQQLRTPQKLAVLRALAAYTDPYDVAAAAGMDVRKANWQRRKLVTLLNLPSDASRLELLVEAGRRGLLGGARVVEDDGRVPAVPPPTRMPAEPARATVALFTQAPAPAVAVLSVPVVDPASEGRDVTVVRVRAPRRDRFTAIAGQLSIDDLTPEATVSLLLTHSVPLEAAA